MVFRWSRSKRVHIKSTKKKIIQETDRLVKDLRLLSKRKPTGRTEITYKHLLLLAEIDNLIAGSLMQLKEPTYLVSSLFLQDSFKVLNQRAVESLHFITGPEIGEIKVLDRIVNFELEQQNTVYAKANSESIRRVLIQLNEYKFKLWGYFHIHPGSGASSTFPSSTDLTLAKLLDRGGYEAIGAIFSRDGFVRFFSQKQFKIQVYGGGVEKINERLFHLVKIG